MISRQYIESIASNYRNPWLLIVDKYGNTELSRIDILTIVEVFNKTARYK